MNLTSTSPARFAPTSAETLTERAVIRYLSEIVDSPRVSLGTIRDALLQRINAEFALENAGRSESHSSSGPIQKIQSLDERTVTRVLLARHRIVSIDLSGGRPRT